jgi:hypothetical protein
MDSNDSPHATQPRTSAGLVPGLLLAFSAIWCVYWFVHAWNYWEDDAYIHLEFARSLASGQGFAFNGHAVAGDTAPLWVLLLAGVHAFIPDWLVAGKVLTAFAAFFGFAGIYRFAQALAAQLLPSSALLPILPAAILVLTAVNPYTCYWIFSGMEPIAAAGLACFATLAATRERPTTASFLTACSLAGLAPLLRPEMAFLTALLFLPIYAQARRMPASGGRPVLGLILLIAPLALWSLYSLHAFGHLMPNTNAAKRAGPHDSVVLRLLSAYSLGFPVIVCGLLGGIACLCLRRGLPSSSCFWPCVRSHSRAACSTCSHSPGRCS